MVEVVMRVACAAGTLAGALHREPAGVWEKRLATVIVATKVATPATSATKIGLPLS
jgi:hypothetical protein